MEKESSTTSTTCITARNCFEFKVREPIDAKGRKKWGWFAFASSVACRYPAVTCARPSSPTIFSLSSQVPSQTFPSGQVKHPTLSPGGVSGRAVLVLRRIIRGRFISALPQVPPSPRRLRRGTGRGHLPSLLRNPRP